jgi:hydrogenase nickel incorporation protein HypA/HybF
MHELSIALSIIDAACEEAERHAGARVVAVHLKLGPLSGVVKEALVSAYELAREGSPLGARSEQAQATMRAWYESNRLTDAQAAAIKWLAGQPGGPAKVLVISEEWSSDCRRDVPMFARIAEAGGMDLRIFTRDGQKFSASARPTLAEAPDSNADLMAEFLNEKNGQTWQSIPVAVFYTKDLTPIYRYVEFPAIYHKDRVVNGHIRAPRPGETPEETRARSGREFGALQQSPFFRVWASAAVDEIISALHRRLVIGPNA